VEESTIKKLVTTEDFYDDDGIYVPKMRNPPNSLTISHANRGFRNYAVSLYENKKNSRWRMMDRGDKEGWKVRKADGRFYHTILLTMEYFAEMMKEETI
jgi:hypothetical protein